MKYPKILNVAQGEGITFVVAGLAVEGDGYAMSPEQMDNMEAHLAANEAAAAAAVEELATSNQQLEAATEQLTAAQAATEELQQRLTASEAALVAANERIAALEDADASDGAEAPAGKDNRTDPNKYLTSYDKEKARIKAKIGG